jgi:hypothetical protein
MRHQFLTSEPVAGSYEALNAKLAADFRAQQAQCCAMGGDRRIGSRHAIYVAAIQACVRA